MRKVESVAALLLVLAAVSALQDSRSLTGMLVVVMALLFTQGAPGTSTSGRAALVATHNERIAAKMDRILRLHDGVIG